MKRTATVLLALSLCIPGWAAGRHSHKPTHHRTTHTRTHAGKPTAKCRDGTLSYSQSRRGTCSHHGGVAEWK